MSQPDGPPVVDYISAVVGAYADATNLVQRIKHSAPRPLPEDALASLEISLALGPPIVQGQYDLDVKRIGQNYIYGDDAARENMSSILANLQTTLLAGLQRALMDNLDLDYSALQASSDDSRVSSIVCLSQLGQRLRPSIAKPKVSIPSPPPPGVSEMGAQSDVSDLEPSRLSVATSMYSPTFSSENMSATDPTSPVTRERGSSFLLNRPPQTYMTNVRAELPANESDSFNGSQNRHSTSAIPSSRNNGSEYPISTIRESGSEVEALYSYEASAPQSLGPRTFPSRPNPPILPDQRLQNDSQRDQWNDQATNSPDAPPPTQVATPPSASPNMWFKHRYATSTDDSSRSLSKASTKSNFLPGLRWRPPSMSAGSGSGPSSSAVDPDPSALYLPCEENGFAGFCKGAWKLQTGVKKAMRAEQRPAGMFSQILFWRCSKCLFEGPMNLSSENPPTMTMHAPSFSRTTPLDKPGRSFDHRVRVHAETGVRYRWAFLAKSHAFCRDVPKATDGSTCSYGCIYCCSERRGPAPVFGNIDTFMHHLRLHDGESIPGHMNAPAQDLLNRTKCIMGRMAQDYEEFDINIPPVSFEVQG
ncbi:hypothetical protein FQN51_004165 [Onygenales sp. PD_10]|nr:hypothetical protein FQN51_004165 [Onygenales sp. PD_10]